MKGKLANWKTNSPKAFSQPIFYAKPKTTPHTCATLARSLCVCVCVWFLQLFLFCCSCCCARHINPFVGRRRRTAARSASARLLSVDGLGTVWVRLCVCYFPAFGPAISMKAIKHTHTHRPAAAHSAAFKAGKRTQHSSFPTHTNTLTAAAGETQLVAVHFVVVVVNFNTYLFTQPSTQCTSKKPKQPKQPKHQGVNVRVLEKNRL